MRKLITYMMEDPRTISPASTWCSWPRPSSAWATTPRTWPSHHLHRQGHRRAPHLDGSGRRRALSEPGGETMSRAGGRGRIGDCRADRHQPAPCGHEVTLAPTPKQAQACHRRVLPDLVVLDWMLPGQSGCAGAALARRPAHARAAHHHAHRACRGGRQDRRPGRRRRRLPDQAVLHQGTAGAHPRRAAPQGARGAGRGGGGGRPAAGPGHPPRQRRIGGGAS
jgi:CheY-like chemotaxis protein